MGDARLSRFYGFDCAGLTPARNLELEGAMRVLEAEEELKTGVPDDRVYDLVLAATGSEDQASAAYSLRLMQRMKRDEKPDV